MEFSGPWNGPLSGFIARKISRITVKILLPVWTVLGQTGFAAVLPPQEIPLVRVMVERESSHLRIQGFDLVVSDAMTGQTLQQADRRAQFTYECSKDGRITNSHGVTKLGPFKIESQSGFMKVAGRQYRDALYLYSLRGDCVVVNHVDLEKYVAGLLNSEMSSKWNLETLKAQAVAARTYAIYQMREASTVSKKNPFDLDSSVKDQVYEGAHQERYQAIRAVTETHGEVLTYAGKPIKAFYHSTCGGHTETPEKVWGLKVPYFKSVTCGYCNHSPRYSWSYSAPLKAVEGFLKSKNLLQGDLRQIRVFSHNRVGRAALVEIVEEQGRGPSLWASANGIGGGLASERTLSDANHNALPSEGPRQTTRSRQIPAVLLRDALGLNKIRSTDFQIIQSGDWLTFAGRGSGHGVGLCQWGAKAMGELGFSYRDILSKYYPLAQIKKIY